MHVSLPHEGMSVPTIQSRAVDVMVGTVLCTLVLLRHEKTQAIETTRVCKQTVISKS
jgi:hypothetical protein